MKIICKLFILFIVLQAGLSCKKELSCENCSKGNKAPVANAGPDQVITLPASRVTLDGTASRDPEGTIAAYQWIKIEGASSCSITSNSSATTEVIHLLPGRYLFELKVTDTEGLSAKDTVQVVVEDPANPNRPPVAHAGADQVITLPVNSVQLDGRGSADPDNNITGYEWLRIAGPSAISSSTTVQVQVTGLIQGVYLFELTVTDAAGLLSKDTMQVTVNSPLTGCNDCRIVFVSMRDGNEEIYTCNADGSNILRLTANAAYDDDPAWSPDGTKIAFISDRSGHTELYIMNRDGSNIVRRTYTNSSASNPSWSPDGTKIVYSAMGNGSMDIFVIGAETGAPTLLFTAPGWDSQPKWSPDGTKIVLASDWMAYDFVYDIYMINANGGGFTALTGNIFDHVDYLYPSWAPNGSKLAITISETVGMNQYVTKIGIINPGGGGITVITPAVAATWSKTSWSPDGTKIAYTILSGSQKDIFWVSPDGLTGGRIVENGWNADWQQ